MEYVEKSGEVMKEGAILLCRGQARVVAKWQARWSMRLSVVPHVVHILWAGETVYQTFTSDATGGFSDLEVA